MLALHCAYTIRHPLILFKGHDSRIRKRNNGTLNKTKQFAKLTFEQRSEMEICLYFPLN